MLIKLLITFIISGLILQSCSQQQSKPQAESQPGDAFFSLGILRKPHSLDYKESFDFLANDIVRQDAIFEMNDFTRHYKSVNETLVYLGDKVEGIDTLLCKDSTDRCPQALNLVLDSFKIDRKIFYEFQDRLKSTELMEFYKSNDSVLFIVDGFLSHSWGFFYSKDSVITGNDEFPFGMYRVSLLDTINVHWRKAAID